MDNTYRPRHIRFSATHTRRETREGNKKIEKMRFGALCARKHMAIRYILRDVRYSCNESWQMAKRIRNGQRMNADISLPFVRKLISIFSHTYARVRFSSFSLRVGDFVFVFHFKCELASVRMANECQRPRPMSSPSWIVIIFQPSGVFHLC